MTAMLKETELKCHFRKEMTTVNKQYLYVRKTSSTEQPRNMFKF